ncbi:MAG TPA: BadF/BadG/BcrA/BcrD ATPase family protein [Candidatus Dormibacteraeota bacterium]|nr:BadF/BadG/BcrA/BcrD ATPase family protein [Candidatus Dormibacteraeota bacterium]
MSAGQPLTAVLAVDGGNSKTDLALVGSDGSVLAVVHGPSVSHQQVGLQRGLERLARLAEAAAREAGLDPARRPLAAVGSFCLAGVDSPADVRRHAQGLAAEGLAGRDLVHGDVEAALRAGASQAWGVALVCGAGINGAGRAPDGRTVRFPALGTISGDWGGGEDVGLAALGAAVRARDGRGPRTAFERAVPSHFGLARPVDVSWALEQGRLPQPRLAELAPLVYRLAAGGDGAALEIVDRLADEVAAMASALIRRLRLARLDVEVVLGGGLLRDAPASLVTRVRAQVERVAPAAKIIVLDAPPLLGAALLGMDALGSGLPARGGAAEANLRAGLGPRDLARMGA